MAPWEEWLRSIDGWDLVVLIGAILAIAGALVRWALKLRSRVRPWLEKSRLMLDDWAGVPARAGVERRPGVMEQLEYHGTELAKQSAQLDDHTRRLERLDGLTAESVYNGKANGGHSPYDEMTDRLKRIETLLNRTATTTDK